MPKLRFVRAADDDFVQWVGLSWVDARTDRDVLQDPWQLDHSGIGPLLGCSVTRGKVADALKVEVCLARAALWSRYSVPVGQVSCRLASESSL